MPLEISEGGGGGGALRPLISLPPSWIPKKSGTKKTEKGSNNLRFFFEFPGYPRLIGEGGWGVRLCRPYYAVELICALPHLYPREVELPKEGAGVRDRGKLTRLCRELG